MKRKRVPGRGSSTCKGPGAGSGKSLRTFREGKEEARALKEAEETEPWVPD